MTRNPFVPNFIPPTSQTMKPVDYQAKAKSPKPGRIFGDPRFNHLRQQGRGKRLSPGEMNKVETAYASYLDSQLKQGMVEWFAYEAMTFKLAPDTRYTPDFAVMFPDGRIELHEVKGGTKNKKTGERTFFAEEDAKLKIKIASAIIPFRVSIVYPIPGGQWGRKDYFGEASK